MPARQRKQGQIGSGRIIATESIGLPLLPTRSCGHN